MSQAAAIREVLIETADELSGYKRRHFKARVVKKVYNGNQSEAERELGWNRGAMRKALSEWEGE